MECPVCRAENPVGPDCRRCKADLSLLFQVEVQGQLLKQKSCELASTNQWEKARKVAEESLRLQDTEEIRKLISVCHLGQGNFKEALLNYLRINRIEKEKFSSEA